MGPLEISIIVIALLVALLALTSYFLRSKNYKRIDVLDKEKNSILQHAPYDELRDIGQMNISGHSAEYRTELLDQWKEIEKKQYPAIEQHLFNAEQATDKYRFKRAGQEERLAAEALENIRAEISALESSLTEFLKREEANLTRINTIKENYHDLRKELLAESFDFGDAMPELEKKLADLEEYFTKFSELTVAGDHEEANKILAYLDENIQEIKANMTQIPEVYQTIQDEYQEQLKEIEQVYSQLLQQKYVFPEDNIPEALADIRALIDRLLEKVEQLELAEVAADQEQIATMIDAQYEVLEREMTARQVVYRQQRDIRQALPYLEREYEQNARHFERLQQSYVLVHNEKQALHSISQLLEVELKKFDQITERLRDHELQYSEAETLYDRQFTLLEKLNAHLVEVKEFLASYRQEELRLKEALHDMEQAMYEMKRSVESRRLPGVSEEYLMLFFSTTDRIERFSQTMTEPVLNLEEAKSQYELCREDSDELSRLTDEIIDQSTLCELTSQRLLRYREEYRGVEETIRYSRTLFEQDFDYAQALQLVKEKLEKIAPGEYDEILAEYSKHK